VARREALPAGASIAGPAIIEEPTATTVVPPGWTAEVDSLGLVVLKGNRS
jgi:N-methylhydantoinase A/oxoprolinase/acetone carboxylase beta subunit